MALRKIPWLGTAGRSLHCGLLAVCGLLPIVTLGAAPDDLAAAFAHPPASARPWTWWHWMDGNVTKEGITADLTAMQRIGIAGAQVFQVDARVPAGPVQFMSAEWHDLVAHAMREAARLQLELGFHNSAGWSGSGGPWITPSRAMKKVTLSEARAKGPGRFQAALAQPPTWLGFYRDIAVLAFPLPPGAVPRGTRQRPLISGSAGPIDGAALLDDDPETFAILPAPTPSEPQFVQFSFLQREPLRSVRITPGPHSWGCRGVIQASDDGVTFRDLASVQLPKWVRDTLIVALPEGVSCRFLRLTFTSHLLRATQLALAGIEVSPQAVLADLGSKTGLLGEAVPVSAAPHPSAVARISRDQIVNLTDHMDEHGNIDIEMPAGDWVIQRIGYTATGKLNHPAPESATGPECDKLSREALEVHWRHAIEPLRRAASAGGQAAFTNLLIDSHEAGGQNWSENFREEFRRRRGYDPVPYLPAFAGFVIDEVGVTERFLWDLRRTIADLMAENHHAHFAELCRRSGLRAFVEPYGGPFETAQAAGAVDVPMAEFWTNGEWHASVAAVASAAHTYGKPIVAAEAFTTAPTPLTGRWADDPWSLKALGDRAFAGGINRLVIHTYAMQPWNDHKPGMTMGMWGIHFVRTNTWWEQARAWIEYCSRAQHLLQQGRSVADVAFFTGEDIPWETHAHDGRVASLPAGFAFDWLNPAVLVRRTEVRNHALLLPDGTTYRLLVLPDGAKYTPETLERLGALVRAGLTVVGPRPTGSPSLSGFPSCDARVEWMTQELWGPPSERIDRRVGAGRVVSGLPLPAVLASMGLTPDVAIQGDPAGLLHTHRSAGGADIFFLSNQRDQTRNFEASFRVAGRIPELWHADTGQTEIAPVFREENGRTTVRLRLHPRDSIFVVFRKPALRDHVVAVRAETPEKTADSYSLSAMTDGTLEVRATEPVAIDLEFESGARRRVQVGDIPAPLSLSHDWKVAFPGPPAARTVQLPRLDSWSDSADPAVRYFSGTATYTKTIIVPAGWVEPDHSVRLELGSVMNLAEVRWNGRPLATLWKQPFALDVTGVLRAGENEIEIRVTNLWVNRLIGDEHSPAEDEYLPTGELARWPEWLTNGLPRQSHERVTFTTWRHYSRDAALLPSGLLGPVTLRVARHATASSGNPSKRDKR